MNEKIQKYELLFITVPPPRSGNIVGFLTDLHGVVEAAAVYTDIDVVALVKENDTSTEQTVETIQKLGTPIEKIERLKIDSLIEGQSVNKGRAQGHSSFFAFVRCKINTKNTNFEFVLQRLSKIDSVRYIYPVKNDSEIIIQIVASDKIKFDEAIMSKIQDTGGMIKYTRTYLVINEMHWSDIGIPTSRKEYTQKETTYPVFMSLSSEDHDFGVALADRIYKDTQIKIWHYGHIKPGASSWAGEVDKAINNASAHLMIVTDKFIESSECQREFGKIEAMVDPEKICCLVMPSIEFSALPHRYQARQCVDGKKFFSYSNLIQWIEDVV